jgi:hypothetical protein
MTLVEEQGTHQAEAGEGDRHPRIATVLAFEHLQHEQADGEGAAWFATEQGAVVSDNDGKQQADQAAA